MAADGRLTVTCVHGGYEKKYRKVRAFCLGKEAEGILKDGRCEIRL